MRLRIGDVGFGPSPRLLDRRRARSGGIRHRRVELPEADGGEVTDETSEDAEMMSRRRVRHTGLARHRAQRQPGEAIALEHPFGRLEQRVAQGAVMVRSLFAWA